MNALAAKNTDDIADLRRSLCEQGYHHIPVLDKGPRIPGWAKKRITASQVDGYLRQHPDHVRTGILCGNDLVAIDIDAPTEAVSEKLIERLTEIVPAAELAPRRTGKAPKCLFLFRATEPGDKSVTPEFMIEGAKHQVEVLRDGQQFVAFGDHVETGKPYTWANGSPMDIKPADLPPISNDDIAAFLTEADSILTGLGQRVKEKPKTRRAHGKDSFWQRVNTAAIASPDRWVKTLFPGAQHQPGTGAWRVSSEELGRNLEEDISVHPDGIQDFGREQGATPIELVREFGGAPTAKAAADWLCERLDVTPADLGWEQRQSVAIITGRTALPKPANDDIRSPASPRSDGNPFTPEACGGLMADISRWILDTSRRKSPEFAVMSGIAFMSVFYGRRVIGPTSCGVNLYLAGIAGPGFGKEAPLQRLVKLLQDTDMAFLVGAGEVSSASAIEKILRRKPVVVMPWDEVGDVLESINAKGNGNWASTIRKAMLELYSKSTGVWFGKETMDDERIGAPIHCPSLTVIGTSTPTRFYGGLSEKNLSDGFAARMVFIAPTKRPERGNPRDGGLVVPAPLREAIKEAQKKFPWPSTNSQGNWRTPDVQPHLYEVPWADEAAEAAWLAIEDWQEAEIERDETRDGLVGRLAENAIRLATLRALSRSPSQPSVNVEDVRWAHAIMSASVRSLDDGVDKYMSSSQFEQLCQAILSSLRSSRGGSMYRAELLKRRGISGSDTRTFDAAILRLQETREIEKTDGKRFVLSRAGSG
ncbi:bifunctional DNA primase/polymerase [Bradyrhizobium lablabi]|uniref:bifunctional DNA primase/polymerase n=1 Tax=Bradyrhizobium lablabi TaxID=722472 RepID=UPI001BA558DB|nr:bifunctional DNA primase/polymerase [Bradyrhizobium lablabi]MBR0695866.1 bifunctional DNA primase/polymerase [Bradyrhizobium lablabi]